MGNPYFKEKEMPIDGLLIAQAKNQFFTAFKTAKVMLQAAGLDSEDKTIEILKWVKEAKDS